MRYSLGMFLTSGVLFLSPCAWAGQAKAVISGTMPELKISGEILLNEENGGLSVEANLTGLTPGKHAFHIHENGSCADAGKAAGGHFNPDKVTHGYMPKDGAMRAHPGDMGNIEAGADGKATLNVFLPEVALTEGKYAVLGKSVIVHDKEDDFSQPTGNAGGRVGCGIIEAASDASNNAY
ncbi:MAG: superoxide dismutase family protein [Candidatus Omnitrophica bacterium]|nr:superoxide dismutase family protein [Candidatus Omnitrophota bacterium]